MVSLTHGPTSARRELLRSERGGARIRAACEARWVGELVTSCWRNPAFEFDERKWSTRPSKIRSIVGSDEVKNANALDHGGEEWDFVSNATRPLIRSALDSLTPADINDRDHLKDHSGGKRIKSWRGPAYKVSPWKADILFRRRRYDAVHEEHLLYLLFNSNYVGNSRWDGDTEARAWARENFIPNPEQPLWGIDRGWPHIVLMECMEMVEAQRVAEEDEWL